MSNALSALWQGLELRPCKRHTMSLASWPFLTSPSALMCRLLCLFPVLRCRSHAAAAPTCGPVLDPEEPEAIQKLRKDIHAIRVSLIRAAQRLGYDHENGLVKQVLYR